MALMLPFLEVLDRHSRLTLLAWGFFVYLLCLVIYRQYLSPIANVPGPRLTAITSWCQFYHDVIRGGQFTFVIQKWHEKYGPIVRINPTEIHISDPDFYDTIYSQTRVNKQEFHRYRLGHPGALHATVEKDLHQNRRDAVAPYFSRRHVLEFTSYIQTCADKLCYRLNNENRGMFKVVTLDAVFAAFATDNIVNFVFATSYDFLNSQGFETPFTTALAALFDSTKICGHFPWLLPFMESLPRSLCAAIQPSLVPLFNFRDEMKIQTRKAIDREYEADKNVQHKPVFGNILHSGLPPEELSLSRLRDEASIIVIAGISTTATTMSIACFHVLNSPSIYRRLCQELTNAFPDLTMQPTLPDLEKLPYLTAVLQESLRFSYGTSQRTPRIFESAVEYGPYTIPPGVPISLTCYIQHHDERIFPSSHTFIPDRWLDNPMAPGTDQPLSTYLVSFSKGTRNCLGMNLGYAELYIGLATVFRLVKMELFETQRDAVDMASDHVVQTPKAGTKGVRVLIK
ncbi:hypothetical protein MMC29_000156 [Sticta canariensis]|nr:hypothetical protein [Sticta canariensis]